MFDSARKILLVDDEDSVLRVLRRVLFDEPWEIFTAPSGDDALSMVYDHDFAVVVSDYKMPHMNGVELLREVKRISPFSVRMILSGFADTHAVVEAINEGEVYRFVPKPWDNQEIVNIIRQGVELYNLSCRNLELEAALYARNAELAAINENLERMVEERTRDLLAHNQALTFVQEVLDELPLAIVGVDPSGTVVLVNKKAAVLFPRFAFALGLSVEELLPEDVIEYWDSFRKEEISDMIQVNLEDKVLGLKCVNIKSYDSQPRGTVLVFVEQD